jgi:acyl-CoA synthetase (AMP-forming)/AMP-acid ligase II
MNAVPQGDCAPVSALTALANANGFFRIVVRKKDLIITSGVNVNPTDVEHGLRHVEDVEDVWAVVTREHLEGHTRPRVIAIVPGPLPRNPRGKVLRRVLRDQQNTEAGCRARVRGTCGSRGGAGNRARTVPWWSAYAGDLGWHARTGTIGLPRRIQTP